MLVQDSPKFVFSLPQQLAMFKVVPALADGPWGGDDVEPSPYMTCEDMEQEQDIHDCCFQSLRFAEVFVTAA